MKAFKSLQAYKYFQSGFVLKTGTKIVNDFYVLVAKVKHSQRSNEKPLDVWCIIDRLIDLPVRKINRDYPNGPAIPILSQRSTYTIPWSYRCKCFKWNLFCKHSALGGASPDGPLHYNSVR
ncbi:hypothetical protein NQ315_000039 [Exocentrus adspersus]|uniref:SWIM-type domain-containing protein n=1 Tax=Exocentrus adspersus TaxID=1586481 RepID=A0AAV8VG30_9CUCU|nr:hypothetical protein NQ315_000039 [Exocentrus adspersus]